MLSEIERATLTILDLLHLFNNKLSFNFPKYSEH